MSREEIIVDGEHALMGRLASYAAKQALLGKKIIIINVDKVFVSGNRKNIIANYIQMRQRKNTNFPSQPEQILKRTIRGMINYKEGRGEEAFKHIRCYDGIPAIYADRKKIKSGKEKKNLMTLKELGEMLK